METNDEMTRVEAAAYLVTKGITKATPNMLARLAVDDRGPPFAKNNNLAVYKQVDLDTWATARLIDKARGAKSKAGRPRKAPTQDELREALAEFLPLVDKLVKAEGTFQDGVRYAHTVERLRRALRLGRNGVH